LIKLFHIDPNLKIPIYQQLVDELRASIKNGNLPIGTRLPTVRDLSNQLNVAPGTVKRAYDELHQEGFIKLIQGRGSFVSYKPMESASRKDRAMKAIDNALRQMEDMGFSLSEINIFLNLKLRELADKQDNIRVELVESCPELLSQISRHLRRIDRIDLYSTMLDNVMAYPYTLGEETDIVVTTADCADNIEGFLPDKKKLAKIALRLSSKTIKQIIKLSPEDKVGIICAHNSFGEMVYRACRNYTEADSVAEPITFKDNIGAYIKDKTVLLLPEGYEQYCSADTIRRLAQFSKSKPLINCLYHIDEGSFMYLREKIERLIEKKSI
jgi:DNA-binding transcriptional regulator YhcF (GntR family)